MTNWKSLGGKFSPEEYLVIQEFQKKLGLNENQFIKFSVMSTIFVYGTMIKLAESDQAKEIDKKYTNFKKKIAKYPELKEVKPFVEDMTKSMEQAMNQIIKDCQPEIKKFTKKRKVGRPKSRKKKRGRPADKGNINN